MTEEQRPSQLPIAVTSSRLALAPILFVIWSQYGFSLSPPAWLPMASAGLVGLAMATDWLDGWLARKLDSATVFGRIVDPLVDKIVILGTLVYMTAMPWTHAYMPAWAVATILMREIIITGLRGEAERRGFDFGASPLGKAKTTSQVSAILAVFFVIAMAGGQVMRNGAGVLVGISIILTIVSGVDYIRQFVNEMGSENGVSSSTIR